MNKKNIAAAFCLLFATCLKAQSTSSDSIDVASTLKELLSICKNVDFGDPKVFALGTFYKAAPYIIYRGEDKARSWKDFANYKVADEKKGVDEVCFRINGSVNQDSTYKIVQYQTETESEGKWYILHVSYNRKGVQKHTAFAFLKIGNRFGLGDID
jgi:hypothetical protein